MHWLAEHAAHHDNQRVPDPLDYRRPEPRDEAAIKRQRAQRAVWAGLWAVALSAALVLSPLLLGRWMLNKYIVAGGCLGLAWGLSCLLNGSIDLWRTR